MVIPMTSEPMMMVLADQAISVPDLCRELFVSRRTLQSAFQAGWGMGPLAWLTTLRLNAVRRALRDSYGYWVREVGVVV